MLYKIVLFLHVSGALLLFAAITIEWFFIMNIRKAGSLENIKGSLTLYSFFSKIGQISMILILFPGIYMMVEV